MSDFPIRADRLDRQMRKLIDDAERAVAMHEGDLADFARRILAGRQRRDLYFDPVLFSNPAWDILLNLYVANAEGRDVSVIDTCSASAIPASAALRWLGYLKQEEMVIESADPLRPQMTLLNLSEQMCLTIRSYLGSLIDLGLGPEQLVPDIAPVKS